MKARSINETLTLLRGGQFADECSELLKQLVKGVDETGKAGKLVITLAMKKSAGAIEIVGTVTDKTPEPKPDSDLLWPTVEGHLSQDNPAQQKLDLRVAEKARAEVRTVDPDTGEIRVA